MRGYLLQRLNKTSSYSLKDDKAAFCFLLTETNFRLNIFTSKISDFAVNLWGKGGEDQGPRMLIYPLLSKYDQYCKTVEQLNIA